MLSSLFHHTAGRTRAGSGGVRSLPARQGQDLSTPLDEAAFVVFDTELTGLNSSKDSIVSLGAIKMQGKKILLGRTFYHIVEPKTALTAKSVLIHEITPTEAAASPGLDALLPEFLDFCGNAVLAGHVVSIDLGFLNKELRPLYGSKLQNPAVDTLKIHQWLRKKEEDVCAYHGGLAEPTELSALAKKYQVPVQQAHNALSDAFVTAQLLQKLLHQLPRWGITTLGGLVRIGKP